MYTDEIKTRKLFWINHQFQVIAVIREHPC